MCDLKAKKSIRADLGHQKFLFCARSPKQKAVSEQKQRLKCSLCKCIEPSSFASLILHVKCVRMQCILHVQDDYNRPVEY